VEAVFKNKLGEVVQRLLEGGVGSAFWIPILRSKTMSAAIEQNSFPGVISGMEPVPLHLWVDVLGSRGALKAVLRCNFERVLSTLACVDPELWAGILNSTGFTEVVVHDELEQLSTLGCVPHHLWAAILNASGACTAIEWKNFSELTGVLLKNSIAVEHWPEVLNMSTPAVYEAVFNEEMAPRVAVN
jgi:hypothetical protein